MSNNNTTVSVGAENGATAAQRNNMRKPMQTRNANAMPAHSDCQYADDNAKQIDNNAMLLLVAANMQPINMQCRQCCSIAMML